MAVPKSKISSSKRGMRRAHDRLKNNAYVEDKDTGELHRPHHIDLKTGMYRGKEFIKVSDKSTPTFIFLTVIKALSNCPLIA